ncbi:MAG: type II secretion system F family protein [Lachnospiraceae bacterium]|nr:type II secretion system F family protein [Lachnospiraceae bacterium]MBO5144719.1 type II secretion system F family protein [Lachnospiraceae bacterium]
MKQIHCRKNISIRENRSRLPPETDYASYKLSRQETVVHLLLGAAFIAVISRLFYDSIIAWLLMMPFVFLSIKDKSKALCRKRKRALEAAFREVILSVSANLQAGYSVENAFREAYKDIVILFGKESLMAEELRLILRKLDNNEQLEAALRNLAERSGVQDIKDFADIFQIAKRGSGNIRSIIANTADIIGGKQEVRREIETVVSEKKLEQQIMRYIPFLIMIYISFTTKGYFESLYHNPPGWLIATVSLIVYAAACRLSDAILDIEI